MNRIVVVGSSGSGKTTVAGEIAIRLEVPHLEMDAVRHADGWDSTPDTEFRRILAQFTSGDRWVIDGNYTNHGAPEVVWPRVDTVVWTDMPKWLVVTRVIRRTLKRMITREELWNGLREPLTNLYSLDPYRNIIVWTWTRYDHEQSKFEKAMTDGSWDHATVHRLRSPRGVEEFLEGVG